MQLLDMRWVIILAILITDLCWDIERTQVVNADIMMGSI